LCGIAFRPRFPSDAELERIYADAYAGDKVSAGDTGQESGSYADDAYASFLLARYATERSRVLDFGAATGALVARLRAAGVSADGLEYSARAREWCREHNGFDLSSGPEQLQAGSYDLITMIEVIEHLSDLWGTLASVRGLLRPGGKLFVTTPNRRGLRGLLEGEQWAEATKDFHLFLFDPRSLKHHLDRNGLETKIIRFCPVVKRGPSRYLFARATQLLGLGGTICVLARLPRS
jgi:SAM-dependent methyltransferase